MQCQGMYFHPLSRSSTFTSSNKLSGSPCQPVPSVFFILFFLKESVVHTQQLVCGSSGEEWGLRLRAFRWGEGLSLLRGGLGTKGVLAGRGVGAHSVYICGGR